MYCAKWNALNYQIKSIKLSDWSLSFSCYFLKKSFEVTFEYFGDFGDSMDY